jgi:hypothetical protein
MQLADRLILDAPKRTPEGYFAVRAKAAKSGIYDYLASETDAPDKFKATDTVKVYRDAAEVFAADSVRSFIGKPITNDHPHDAVTTSNWRDHARGVVMGAIRDGDYLAFDLVLMDQAAIDAVENGKRELSNGYSCQLDWTPGTAPDGTAYDARQTSIKGNHVALVDAGRAGPNCAIKDGERFALCDANPAALADLQPKGNAVKKIVLDGLQVDLSDADAVSAAFDKLQGKVTTAETALADATKAHDKALAAKDTEIDDLKGKVVDQAAIDALADAKADVVAKAKAVCGDKLPDTAGKTVAEVRRMACDAKGIATADKSDDYIEARFDALTADVKTEDKTVVNISPAVNVGDAEADYIKARDARKAEISGAWKKPASAQAA